MREDGAWPHTPGASPLTGSYNLLLQQSPGEHKRGITHTHTPLIQTWSLQTEQLILDQCQHIKGSKATVPFTFMLTVLCIVLTNHNILVRVPMSM